MEWLGTEPDSLWRVMALCVLPGSNYIKEGCVQYLRQRKLLYLTQHEKKICWTQKMQWNPWEADIDGAHLPTF